MIGPGLFHQVGLTENLAQVVFYWTQDILGWPWLPNLLRQRPHFDHGFFDALLGSHSTSGLGMFQLTFVAGFAYDIEKRLAGV